MSFSTDTKCFTFFTGVQLVYQSFSAENNADESGESEPELSSCREENQNNVLKDSKTVDMRGPAEVGDTYL